MCLSARGGPALNRRLLIYSQDGMGLGHLRRSTNIAREFLKEEPGASVLVVADSPAAPFFLAPRGVDYLKLPTIVKMGDSSWQAASLALSLEETLRIRASLIDRAFSEFHPDMVLVDHMPVGALGELRPMLDRALNAESRPRLFLGLRDVLDRPEVIRAVWSEVGAYDYLPAYDAVLVYGSPDLFDAASEYDLLGRAKRIISCNYVATPTEQSNGVMERDEPFILVMGGGGADLYPVARTFIAALPYIQGETPVKAAILPGPNMPADNLDELTELAGSGPVKVLRGFEDATAWLSRASAVVMMAGYNSVCEVMAWRKKALLVPRAGPSAEQRIRSRLFAQRNLVHVLDPDGLTPERLARGVLALLADGSVPDPDKIPPLDGARRAALAMLSMERGGSPAAAMGASVD